MHRNTQERHAMCKKNSHSDTLSVKNYSQMSDAKKTTVEESEWNNDSNKSRKTRNVVKKI